MEGNPLKLSVIVPSIRPQNLLKLYNSIDIEDFEMIVIGPEIPMTATECSGKIKVITSHRRPNAAQQQGLLQATGDYITFAADDGIFLPGALDYAMSMAEERTIVVGKYLEGNEPHLDMEKEDYYRFKYHKAYRINGVPQNGVIFNCGIISRNLICELGGWDCQFEATTMAHADLGIRAKKRGAEMVLMDQPMFKCSHQPGKSGDHKPIHEAMKRDIKTFSKIYASPNDRQVINIDNWKNTEEKWRRRFR